MKKTWPPHLPAVVALGAVCQIGQIVMLREFLMVFHGNELSIGIILAAWMIWVGVGGRWGFHLVERTARPMVLLSRLAVGIMAGLPVTVLGIRMARQFFDVLPGAYLSISDMALACLALMGPVCVMLGAQFVLLARIWREHDGAADTRGAAKTYIAEAAGTMAGGILFTFVLVRHENAVAAAMVAGLLMPAAILWMSRRRPTHTENRRALMLMGIPGVLVIALLPWSGMLDAWAFRKFWENLSPRHLLLETAASKYGQIAVARREDQISFFQSGHLVFSAAGMDADRPLLEEQDGILFAHLALAQHPDPENVLLLGGGARGTLREMIRHPVARVDYVELDPRLLAAARRHVSPETVAALDDPRVRVMHLDGRLYVKTTGETYDVIVVDIPDPATAVLNRYYTVEFFREAAARLNPGGILVMGATSTPDARGLAAANRNATLFHTLRRVFPSVFAAGDRFVLFIAGVDANNVSTDPAVLRRRLDERGVITTAFSPFQFDLLLEEGSLRRLNWALRQHGRDPLANRRVARAGPLFPGSLAELAESEAEWPPVHTRTFINSDFRPIGYYYTLVFWSATARSAQGEALAWLARVQAWWVFPLPVLSLLGIGLWRLRDTPRARLAGLRYAVHFAVFTTGLSTMALQIALLFAFQSVYGFLYEMAGLIIALFMGGLMTGAAIVHLRIPDKSNIGILAGVQLLIAVFAGILAVALPATAGLASPVAIWAVFSFMTFAAGVLNGLDFPLALGVLRASGRRAEETAGMVYGIELFGACAGAALASAVVVPVLGIAACCWLACVANAAAFLHVRIMGGHHGDERS